MRFRIEGANEKPFVRHCRTNGESNVYAAEKFNDDAWENVTLLHDWCYGLDFDENYNISHGHYKLNLCDALCGDPMAIPDKSVFEYLPWSDVKKGVFVSYFEEQRWHRNDYHGLCMAVAQKKR